MMTQEEHTRIVNAFMRKHDLNNRFAYFDDALWLRDLIATVIVDTSMILDGSVPIEGFEE